MLNAYETSGTSPTASTNLRPLHESCYKEHFYYKRTKLLASLTPTARRMQPLNDCEGDAVSESLKCWHVLRGLGTVVPRYEAYFLHTASVPERPEDPSLGPSTAYFGMTPVLPNEKLPQAVNVDIVAAAFGGVR
jgi:hypothetical protein